MQNNKNRNFIDAEVMVRKNEEYNGNVGGKYHKMDSMQWAEIGKSNRRLKKSKDQLSWDVTEERTQKYTIST